MKRVKNYHTLQVLKTADPKLRKAVISNCNKELLNCISECVLNVLNGNIKLPGCVTRKLQKHKAALRSLRQARASLQEKETYCTAWGVPAASIERSPTYARQSHFSYIMLRKMCLIPPIGCPAPHSCYGNRRRRFPNLGRRNANLMRMPERYVNIILCGVA